MANKNSNSTTMNKNKETIKNVSAKVHEELLNTSHLFIDETVATLTRMQKITGKVIKKSEPILEKQIEMTFDAVEALKDQAGKGGKRALKLFGLTKQYNKLSTTISEKIDAIPTAGEVIEDAKELVGKAKSDVEEKFEEIKKIGSIEDIEKIVRNTPAKAKATKTAKKVTAKAKATKVAAKKTVKKVVAKGATAKASAVKTAKKVSAKKPVVKKTAKKVVKATKAVVAKNATPAAKAKIAKKVQAATKVQIAKSELTQIKGIGESLATTMAENGIKTIKDLQNATPAALKVVTANAGNRYKSFDTQKWITAANETAK